FLFCIMFFFFFQAEDGIRDRTVTGVQTCALPISIAFEAWSWSPDGTKLAGIKHLAHGVHSGIGIYDFSSKTYDWVTDFGDWPLRSEERRVGKECRSRMATCHEKKKKEDVNGAEMR